MGDLDLSPGPLLPSTFLQLAESQAPILGFASPNHRVIMLPGTQKASYFHLSLPQSLLPFAMHTLSALPPKCHI
jgi:hypothetical protein